MRRVAMASNKLLALAVALLMGALSLAHAQHAEPSFKTGDATELISVSYDYIVVGAGLAGMVVASRLSEDLDRKVLLIEAGNDTRQHPLVRTVRLDNDELQIKVAGREQIGGRRVVHSLGTGLGGSTSINGAKVDGPPASQIDALQAFGNPSWSWHDVLGYMKKSQNYRPPDSVAAAHGASYDPSGHGVQGPVDVTFASQSYTGHPQECFVRALNATMGIDKIVDAGAGEAVGFSYCPHFIRHGTNLTRVSSATAYYTPIEYERANLHVLTGWRGIRINWHEEQEQADAPKTAWTSAWQKPFFGGVMAERIPKPRISEARASGVTVQSRPGGPTVDLQLRGGSKSEVIAAAGALFTPLLLELSGIGDPAIHAKLDLKTRIDLPGVGRNLADKPTNTLAATSNSLHRHGVDGDPLNAVAMIPLDRIFTDLTDLKAKFQGKLASWAHDAVESGAAVNEEGLMRQYEVMMDGLFRQSWPVVEWEFFSRKIVAIKSFVLQPFSRGFIHSRTRDSMWNVDGNDIDLHGQFYHRDVDMDLQIASMRAARKLLGTDEMREIWGEETHPGLERVQAADLQRGFVRADGEGDLQHSVDDGGASNSSQLDHISWRKYILDTYDLICHNFGTAAMMARELGGVVDEQFKVYGASNVRVVDASIFPMQLSAHPSLTIFGVAEKAADVIRGIVPEHAE